MKDQIKKLLSLGYRYAYSYREGLTLEHCLKHKMVTMGRAKAEELKLKTIKADGNGKVWSLTQELLKLQTTQE